MSQTFALRHNYEERGTFKIYCSLVFGKLIFSGVLLNSVYTNNVLNADVHVWRP